MNISLPQGTPPETIELARRHVESAGFLVNWIGATADPKQRSPQIHSQPGQADDAATVFDMVSALIEGTSAATSEPPPGVGAQRCELGWELVELDDDGSVLAGTESYDSYHSEAEAHTAAWQELAHSHGLEFVANDNEIALRPRYETFTPSHGFDSYREAWAQMAPALACHRLAMAYAVADEANGGGGAVAWHNVDDAHRLALAALGVEGRAAVQEQARSVGSP